jgi:gamma-glutamylcyclotransferase (GGCT)/AIG2-like uncharacterized protein YtfP
MQSADDRGKTAPSYFPKNAFAPGAKLAEFIIMNLFVYGTLRIPAIWEAVSGDRQHPTVPATLVGYRMQRVKGGDFPVMMADPQAMEPIPGALVLNVSTETLRLLDAYEDTFYVRRNVTVTTPEGAAEAEAYILTEERADLMSDAPWTLDWFEKAALARFWKEHFAL